MSRGELWRWFPNFLNGEMVFPAGYSFFEGGLAWEAYYVFIEDVSRIREPDALDDPSGAPFQTCSAEFEGPQVRFRGSGVRASGFADRTSDFDDLTHRADRRRRSRRHRQLQAYFDKEKVWLFDIYFAVNDEDLDAARLILVPASWHMIVLYGPTPDSFARPVILCSTEATDSEDTRMAWLRWIAPVTPPTEVRLRDIFSLNHVGNARLGRGAGEPGPGTPPTPPPRPERPEWPPAGEVLDALAGAIGRMMRSGGQRGRPM